MNLPDSFEMVTRIRDDGPYVAVNVTLRTPQEALVVSDVLRSVVLQVLNIGRKDCPPMPLEATAYGTGKKHLKPVE